MQLIKNYYTPVVLSPCVEEARRARRDKWRPSARRRQELLNWWRLTCKKKLFGELEKTVFCKKIAQTKRGFKLCFLAQNFVVSLFERHCAKTAANLCLNWVRDLLNNSLQSGASFVRKACELRCVWFKMEEREIEGGGAEEKDGKFQARKLAAKIKTQTNEIINFPFCDSLWWAAKTSHHRCYQFRFFDWAAAMAMHVKKLLLIGVLGGFFLGATALNMN